MKLLSTAASNVKTARSQDNRPDYTIVTLSLSPATAAPGLPSNCPGSSPNCVDSCVGNVNVGLAQIWPKIMESRIKKTVFFRENRTAFMKQMVSEIEHERDRCFQNSTRLALRINCFSDIIWERIAVPGTISTAAPHGKNLMEVFPDCDWWDYTKLHFRLHDKSLPENYSLTASWSELPKHKDACAEILHNGLGNVAIVFGEHAGKTGRHAYSQRIPRTWNVAGRDFLVFSGDAQDMRHLDWDPRKAPNAKYGRICGLALKAGNNAMRLRALESGFAVSTD
jgi:hypothetical protein